MKSCSGFSRSGYKSRSFTYNLWHSMHFNIDYTLSISLVVYSMSYRLNTYKSFKYTMFEQRDNIV